MPTPSENTRMARSLLHRCIDGQFRPRHPDIARVYRIHNTHPLVRKAKRIAAFEFGLLWAFDPGECNRSQEGYFRFAPSHDTNVTRRMIRYNFDRARDQLGELNTYATAVHAMGLIDASTYAAATQHVGTAQDRVTTAMQTLVDAIRDSAIPGVLVGVT